MSVSYTHLRIAAHFASLRAEGASPADMAILLGGMTNVALYIEALAEEGFESIISGGSVFASAPEVQLIEALIAVSYTHLWSGTRRAEDLQAPL